ncbi:hypothetical protein L195_g053475 [Trifolium pratense]|uniref:Uncharacterized protein n=1 Tax=Trifolium pratense TaxID=57577 RepID=A0A2K3KAQ3_TRIPR|nr:hypothetical protein L195_g053475 [Trifolium pratense]
MMPSYHHLNVDPALCSYPSHLPTTYNLLETLIADADEQNKNVIGTDCEPDHVAHDG